jgi:hypothetical protein
MNQNRENKLSLEAQYDAVIKEITEYSEFRNRIISRQKITHYVSIFFFRKKRQMYVRQLALAASTSEKQDPEFREEMHKISNVDEQQSPYFNILISEYPLDTLAERIEQKFPTTDFQIIYKLYKARAPHAPQIKNILGQWAHPGIVGVIYGLGTLILRTVPDALLVRFGIDVDIFKIWVFIATLGLVVYIGLFMWMMSRMINKFVKIEKRRHNLFDKLLYYLTIRAAIRKTN